MALTAVEPNRAVLISRASLIHVVALAEGIAILVSAALALTLIIVQTSVPGQLVRNLHPRVGDASVQLLVAEQVPLSSRHVTYQVRIAHCPGVAARLDLIVERIFQ